MANETMRIFFPLKIITYPQGEYGMEDNPMEITPAEAVTYEDAILAVIAGCAHTLGLKSDGTVVAVGDNEYGQCDVSVWRGIQLPGN